MIVKMKFISITGPKRDIDRVTSRYLSKYEIQLENALSELKTTDDLHPFMEINPYREALDKANELVGYLGEKKVEAERVMPVDKMFDVVREANHEYMELRAKENELKEEREVLRERLLTLAPFCPLEFNLHDVLQYKYIKFRFGRVPVEYYHRLEKYVYEDMTALFLQGGKDANFVYGVYFIPENESEQTDAMFKSLHFERLFIPDEYQGDTQEAYHRLEREIQELTDRIEGIDEEIGKVMKSHASELLSARDRLEMLSQNFDVRKLAACVEDKHEDFYILCGWMAEKELEKLLNDVRHDENIFVFVEDDESSCFGKPPTKLENPKLFKPFEMFIEMYGLPAHNEMDPTIFVALTYTFIFGVMFGDVGQGICLFIGGGLLYKWKKMNLAGIISIAGIFSTFFGWMFGSVFGFENIIEARWMRPISNMTNLPFIGKLNSVFIVAVAFGMGIILLSMIFHIINAVKAHDTENIWFDANGLAGLVFYGSVVAVAVLFLTGHSTPAGIVMAVMFGVPLLLMLFKEPLAKKIEKSTEGMTEGKVMFFVQGFFELFETLLSYFSNTLSFVRIGAFAVSHAAMMEVVLMLAGAEAGSPNWLVVVLGNVFVCGMEGLIVGIQVLRLEYYEMFSRFYKGNGRAFKPYKTVTGK